MAGIPEKTGLENIKKSISGKPLTPLFIGQATGSSRPNATETAGSF